MRRYTVAFYAIAVLLAAALAVLLANAWYTPTLVDLRGEVSSVSVDGDVLTVTVDDGYGGSFTVEVGNRCDIRGLFDEKRDADEILPGCKIDVTYEKGLLWRVFGKVPPERVAKSITLY